MSIGWWVRLVCKVLDVVAVGEWLTLWGQVIKPGTRPLSALEIEEARKVLGESVPYPQVRVDEHSLLAWVGALFRLIIQRRFRHLGVVIAYTVNFTRRIHPAPGNEDMAWLIHELVHVAQMEHVGLQYYPEALAAQFCSGYDYGGCQALADGRPLAFFNREQQGEIARDFYRCLYHSPQRAPYYRRQIGDLRLGHV
ncbi:MAG: hypothetical protein D6775_14570 [Caldilineae bacterium]|nr:MAG: hypothetical protein D6775_14570 [Caldilineae bacterium]